MLGAGRIGALRASALAGLATVGEVLVADADAARAEALARELGCRALADAGDVWRERPDGVVVASPTATHAPLVRAAIDAGAAVLCEKPLAPTVRETRELADRAEHAGVPLLVGFQRRFDPAFRALRDRAGTEALGRTHLLRVRHADAAPPPPGYLAQAAATMFADMCVHDFDAVRWIGGEVEAASAIGTRVLGVPDFELHDDVDTAVSVLQLASGAVAVVEASRQGPAGYEAVLELVAADGAEATPAAPSATWLERFAAAFRAEAAAFADTLAGGRPWEGASARDAVEALRIALAAERSFRERRVVSVAEISV